MIETAASGPVCQPNFSAAGRKRRTQAAVVMAVVTVATFATLTVFHAAWWWRALVGLPAMMTVITGLQVRRNTCVAHARTGTFEHDDFSTTKVSEELNRASKAVAATIYRDGV